LCSDKNGELKTSRQSGLADEISFLKIKFFQANIKANDKFQQGSNNSKKAE
jgi:hypothetical protein